ncbi:MAG TPA: peptidylprolyl isomerase [Polyangiaceae bacterium]
MGGLLRRALGPDAAGARVELADLVPAGQVNAMRPVLHFFAIGVTLFVLKSLLPRLAPQERPAIEVVVPEAVHGPALAQHVDEAILVEEGLRFGWAESDPIIRQRLALNMAFARGEPAPTSDAAIDKAAVHEAVALGMHRSDPVVRGRLVSRVQQILDKPAPGEIPDDATLVAHMEANRARFERSPRIELVHLAFTRHRHGEAAASSATALLERLRRGAVLFETATGLADPNPLLAVRQRASVTALDRLFGEGFGRAVAALPVGAWSGPIRSSFGWHIVRVDARHEGRLPPLERVRARVLADYFAATRAARIARRLRDLRQRYSVRVVRGGGSS